MGKTAANYDTALLGALGDSTTVPVVFTDATQRAQWILDALRKVEEAKPKYTSTTITVLDGVLRYDAPAGLLRIEDVRWVFTSGQPDEPVGWSYEPATKKIHLTSWQWPAIAVYGAAALTVFYTTKWSDPGATASDVPDSLDAAVEAWASVLALRWLRRRMLTQGGGVVKFTRGRYSEDGSANMTAITAAIDEMVQQFDQHVGAGDPVVIETRGNVNTMTPPQPLTNMQVGEFGPTGPGDGVGTRSSMPGPVVDNG